MGKVQKGKIADFKPDPKNANKGTERGRFMVEESLRSYGAGRSILVDKHGTIIAGNKTAEAAVGIGLDDAVVVETDGREVVVVRRTDLDLAKDPKAVELAIADNRAADVGLAWDLSQLEGLKADGLADLDKFFHVDELKELARIEVGPGAGEGGGGVPAAPKVAITKTGDLWVMGKHRLLCGDNVRPENMTRLMGRARATCIFTDPPYGVSIAAKNRSLNGFDRASGKTQSKRVLANIQDDDLSPEDLKTRLGLSFVNFRENVMADDCTVMLTAPQGGDLGTMMMMMIEAGLPVRHVLVWKKNSPTFSMGRLDYDYQHEPILLTWGERHKRPMGGKHTKSVWEIDKPSASPDHPTMKPVDLYVNAYLNHTDAGDAVFDGFAGSGPMFIAAELTQRIAYGVEIDPIYCDVIVKRWEEHTGKKAVLEPSED